MILLAELKPSCCGVSTYQYRKLIMDQFIYFHPLQHTRNFMPARIIIFQNTLTHIIFPICCYCKVFGKQSDKICSVALFQSHFHTDCVAITTSYFGRECLTVVGFLPFSRAFKQEPRSGKNEILLSAANIRSFFVI